MFGMALGEFEGVGLSLEAFGLFFCPLNRKPKTPNPKP